MKPFPLQDQRHLDAAEGWLGLGDSASSEAEIAQISPEFAGHPLVLELRYKIFAKASRWNEAIAIASELRSALPENPFGYFHLAYGLHELKRTQEAYDILKAVAEDFPEEWLMRYNLACYCCHLGQLKEAMLWLEKAAHRAGWKHIRKLAADDPDLTPLRSQIEEK